jgi:uncharacterized protein YjcR
MIFQTKKGKIINKNVKNILKKCALNFAKKYNNRCKTKKSMSFMLKHRQRLIKSFRKMIDADDHKLVHQLQQHIKILH